MVWVAVNNSKDHQTNSKRLDREIHLQDSVEWAWEWDLTMMTMTFSVEVDLEEWEVVECK